MAKKGKVKIYDWLKAKKFVREYEKAGILKDEIPGLHLNDEIKLLKEMGNPDLIINGIITPLSLCPYEAIHQKVIDYYNESQQLLHLDKEENKQKARSTYFAQVNLGQRPHPSNRNKYPLYNRLVKLIESENDLKGDELDTIRERTAILLDNASEKILKMLSKRYGEEILGEYYIG